MKICLCTGGKDVSAKRIEIKNIDTRDTAGRIVGTVIEIEIPDAPNDVCHKIWIEDIPRNPRTGRPYFQEITFRASAQKPGLSFILPDGREGTMGVGAEPNSVGVSFKAEPETPFGNQPKGFPQHSIIPIHELPKKDKEGE